MKLILKEKQVKRLINEIILEQNMNIGRGGTDLRRVSHNYLSDNYGLPDGAEHENFYYSARIPDVIKQSEDGDVSKFLSVFTPIQKYNSDEKAYLDYVSVNGQELTQNDITQRVNRTFDFKQGTITATHNGLLAIARAMVGLRGNPGKLTLQFGTQKNIEAGKKERFTQGVVYQSSTSYDVTKAINGLLSLLSVFAIKPENRNLTALYGNTANLDDDTFIRRIQFFIDNIISGSNLFFDPQSITRDTVVSTLTPKGFVSNLNFDINPMMNALKNLRSIDDKINNKEYNQVKYDALSKISNQFIPELLSQMKPIYISNFKIFGANYLPEYSEEISDNADTKVVFPTNLNLANSHKTQLTSYGVQGTSRTGKIQTMSTNY